MGLLGKLTGKVRCPACSSVARHFRDPDREAEVREETAALIETVSGPSLPMDDILEGLGISAWCKRTLPAYICGSCGESFDLETERTWAENARQMGDERAAARYRELRVERELQAADLDQS